jgi:hypothetical protein
MQDESNEPKGPVERGVRRDLPFLGLLSPEKTEAIMRGERVQITAEEAGVFRAQMNLIHDRERDRFRKALEDIAAERFSGSFEAVMIATEALRDA